MKRLVKKAESFSLYSYWNNRKNEFKEFVFNHVRENLDYLYDDTNPKVKRIKEKLSYMDEIDLEMAMSTFLINNNEDLYIGIVENPERDDYEEINYEEEYSDVTMLLRELFENSQNCKELANILDLQIEEESDEY